MKIIITGGAGFIGSHLAKKLVDKGHQTKIIDNLSTGSLKNLNPIKNKITFVKADIRKKNQLIKEFNGFDAVLHQAAFVSVPQSVKQPKLCAEINIIGTKNVLKSAINCGVKRVIFASSCSVYGGIRSGSKADENKRPNPQSPYAESKLKGEHLCQQFAKKNGLTTIILRYFNIYGHGQKLSAGYASVVPTFINRLQSNQLPVIYGTGNQTRDFVYVNDVVRANLLALQADDNLAGEIFNIAGHVISINQLLSIIKNQLNIKNKTLKIKHYPKRPGDIFYIASDNRKSKKLLKYQSKFTLAQGLKDMLG